MIVSCRASLPAPRLRSHKSWLAGPPQFLVALLLGIVWFAPASEARNAHRNRQETGAAKLDYYALVLSWSPTYCATEGIRDTSQCGRSRSYAFVLHGLWPQFARGWPSNCRVADAWLDNDIIASMLDIMPARSLIIHEWRKHGTCSGLGPRGYFARARMLFERVKIPARYLSPQEPVITTPAQLITDFVKTNVGMDANMLSVQCGNGHGRQSLKEVRICFSMDGKLQPCGSNEARSCQADQLVLPPVR